MKTTVLFHELSIPVRSTTGGNRQRSIVLQYIRENLFGDMRSSL
jgi:hypothetical protein